MGWTGEIRPSGQTWRKFFGGKLGAGRTIVACNKAKSLNTDGEEVFYAAVRDTATGEVWPWIVLLDHSRSREYTGYVTWKDLSETGADRGDRGEVCASAAVLDALTATDNPDANEWRAACRAYLAGQPEVTRGSVIRFPGRDLRFSDGKTRTTFSLLSGDNARTEDGLLITLPRGWRGWTRELVSA